MTRDPKDDAVSRRHAHVPQDPLPIFDDVIVKPKRRAARARSRRRARTLPKCPRCSRQPVDVVLAEGDVEVVRDHNRKMHGGRIEPCPASGVPL